MFGYIYIYNLFSDQDKKKAAEQRRARKTNTDNSASTAPSSYSDANSDQSDNTSITTSTTNERGRSQARHRGYRPSEALPERQLASSPMKEQEDEEAEAQQEEEEEARKSWSSGRSQAEVDALPKHHAQLYQLYGKQADYFLHPQPAKAAPQRRPTHPKLKNQKGQQSSGGFSRFGFVLSCPSLVFSCIYIYFLNIIGGHVLQIESCRFTIFVELRKLHV